MNYRLQISTNVNFTGTLTADIDVGNNFYCDLSDHGVGLFSGTQYYWRVLDSDGIVSAANSLRVGLESTPYRLEVSDNDFVGRIVDQAVTGLEYPVGVALARSTAYKWRVSGGGMMTSKIQAFETKPLLTAPTNIQAALLNGRIVHISWAPAAGASFYRVYYRTHELGDFDGEGLVPLGSGGGSGGYFPVTGPELDLVGGTVGTSYWFGVSAVDEEGETGVVLAGSSVLMRDIVPVSNLSVSALNQQMRVVWSPSPDATAYRIFYKTHTDGIYDGSGLRVSQSGPILGAFVDVRVADLADPYHPAVGFYGGVFGTSYWFAVSVIDGCKVGAANVEIPFGFQLLLIPPESVTADYVDGSYRIRWVKNSQDALSNSFLVSYKTDFGSVIYNGTGLKTESLSGPDAPSPILVDSPTVSELRLYGDTQEIPYWFAVASRDAGGNTSAFVPAPVNVTGYGGQLPMVLTQGPGQVKMIIDQQTQAMRLEWNSLEE